MTRTPSRPRNSYVAAAHFRKAGAHGRTGKAQRRADNMAVAEEVDGAIREDLEEGAPQRDEDASPVEADAPARGPQYEPQD